LQQKALSGHQAKQGPTSKRKKEEAHGKEKVREVVGGAFSPSQIPKAYAIHGIEQILLKIISHIP